MGFSKIEIDSEYSYDPWVYHFEEDEWFGGFKVSLKSFITNNFTSSLYLDSREAIMEVVIDQLLIYDYKMHSEIFSCECFKTIYVSKLMKNQINKDAKYNLEDPTWNQLFQSRRLFLDQRRTMR